MASSIINTESTEILSLHGALRKPNPVPPGDGVQCAVSAGDVWMRIKRIGGVGRGEERRGRS